MKQQKILEFWRNVEIFDLPDFNKDAYLIEEGEPLPWLGNNKPSNANYKYRYTIIFGKIQKEVIVEHLNNLLDIKEQNDWEQSVTGFSCLSALILDEKGYPQEDSYVVASYTFGIRILEQNKNLSIVAGDLSKSKDDFLDRYNFQVFDFDGKQVFQGDRVLWEHLDKEISYLKDINKWWDQDINIYLLIETVPKDSEPNTSFLNSFYLNDLNYLSATEKKNDLGIALQSYLTLVPSTIERKDLIQNKELLLQSFDPRSMTSGRWPSKIEYGLYSAQAGAVNTIFSNLRVKEGLQGVNGPPGTGKTTLLLDVIAEVIVERAKVISDLGCDKLFESKYIKIEKESGYDQYTYSLKPSLKNNFGIVVASNNNAAVENISKELPLKKKIDSEIFPDADYFSSCSQLLIEEDSWGTLAAALGNMKNRSTFKKAFWQSEEKTGQIGFNELLHSIYKEEDKTEVYRKDFREQDRLFKSLLHEFENFKKQAEIFHQQLPKYIENKQKEAQFINELAEIKSKLIKLSDERAYLIKEENTRKNDSDKIQTLLSLQLQRKPTFFFFQKLFSTSAYKRWNSEAEELINKSRKITSLLDDSRTKLANYKNEINESESKQKKLKNNLSELNVFFSGYQKLQNILCEKYGIETKNILDIAFLQKDLKEIHLLSPYHSPKIAKLRSDIFIAALQLHQDAILVNAKRIRNNLLAFFEMLSGWSNVNREVAQNLWDTFFLCVPVVSTTLASASRLFPSIDKNQIGWLLIDEAGQATPQSAAGLIHRSKRCVIVGDPLQVEPVVSMPERLVTKLRKEQNVELDWSPCKVSVQQLADRASLSGTYMQVGDSEEKIWTGFPLRTHRRCDNPMFSIANEIAYSNQMVKAINENSTDEFLGASKWFHVECDSTPYNKHVILEEVKFLQMKIYELQQMGYFGNIYVISPFKSVADYCSNEFKKQNNISCGTIHKFQGKEADIVFLLLGSNPASPGARNWASQKPNMLNVALTRAKKRFYVIGNKKLWASCNYFNAMGNVLE
ncbi:superfamily I DNA and/or RNA helicase [Dysgonomonas hofstadii]|uniref:Superfamily I DNA and/or RNA helicase n=1 Tax=Dysgonomonas hofstadii TaxID=637886 RepID=A0A840CVD2_9BACT|nr:ATP-binding protein [Dysgonomonas hofstadii]MBB4038128.1 superfamily I DNA and/or RNA helicase [Dysgonomonas hofstadii]